MDTTTFPSAPTAAADPRDDALRVKTWLESVPVQMPYDVREALGRLECWALEG